jgi:hypothetical protein
VDFEGGFKLFIAGIIVITVAVTLAVVTVVLTAVSYL